ncbi:MAG: YicC/YloC family endoribonuclease [Desulfovibrionales bacterium]
MPRSMTGFGTCEQEAPKWVQSWEIRSVNGKQLSVRWKIPPFLYGLQEKWEKMIREVAGRGRVDVALTFTARTPEELGIFLNTAQAEAMLQRIRELAADQGHSYEPDYNRLLTIGHLWQESPTPPDQEMTNFLNQGLSEAISSWDQSRKREGDALVSDLSDRIERVSALVDLIAERAPEVKEERFALVRERISELLEKVGSELDENRMQQEIVFLADKLDVSEELTRLRIHLDRMRELLHSQGEMGRRFDFLLQESFREVTTCGNKIQDGEASSQVVDCKVELEKCREQVQNLE